MQKRKLAISNMKYEKAQKKSWNLGKFSVHVRVCVCMCVWCLLSIKATMMWQVVPFIQRMSQTRADVYPVKQGHKLDE